MAAFQRRLPPFLALFLFALAVRAEPPARTDAHGDPLPVGALARLGTIRFRDATWVNGVAISPDGKSLAAGSNQGIRILDLATGKELRVLSTNGFAGFAFLAYSQDGKVLGAADHMGRLQFWNPSTGDALGQLVPPQGRPVVRPNGALSFSGDGKYAALGSDALLGREEATHATVFVYEVATGKQAAQAEVLANSGVRAFLSGDGKLLATFGGYMSRSPAADQAKRTEVQQTIQLVDTATGKELRKLREEAAYNISNVAFSPDGKQLVAATPGGLTVWDVATGKPVRRFAGRRNLGALLAYSPDGKVLAAGSFNGAVQTWDVATGRRLGLYDLPRYQTSRATFTSDGRLLASTSNGQAILVWDVFAEKWLTPPDGHQTGVTALRFTADGQVVSVSWDGVVCTWTSSGKEMRRLQLHDEDDRLRANINVNRAAGAILSPDGKQLLASDHNGVRLFGLARGREICSFPASFNPQGIAAAFSPDGGLLVVNAFDAPGRTQMPRLYDVNTGQELRKLDGAAGNELRALAFAPDGKTLVAALNNRQAGVSYRLQTWDPTTAKARWHVDGSQAYVLGAAYTPDGKTLAALEQSGAAVLYDAATGRELRRLGTGAVNSNAALVAFSPDGRLLAIAVQDANARVTHVRLYEVASGTVRHDFAGHSGQVSALAFSADGKRLATGSNDTSVLLWDLTGAAEDLISKTKPTGEEVEKHWAAMGDTNARGAFEAMCRLQADPAGVVALVAKNLKPTEAKGTDEATVTKLIADLDADSFEAREKAAQQLAALGKSVQPALKKALAEKPSAEAQRHIVGLLERMTDPGPAPDLLRPLRAVELLERIGTPDAKNLLGTLAKGQADAPLTVAAAESLRRLEHTGKP
jgi:WD40 repeat protein